MSKVHDTSVPPVLVYAPCVWRTKSGGPGGRGRIRRRGRREARSSLGSGLEARECPQPQCLYLLRCAWQACRLLLGCSGVCWCAWWCCGGGWRGSGLCLAHGGVALCRCVVPLCR